ncbi:hypothetical protein Tco_0589354 [Tanacetum coccineum]
MHRLGKLYLLFLGTNGTVLSLIPDIVPMKVTGESQQTLSPHIKGSVLTQIASDMGEEAMNLAQKLRKGIFTIQQAAAAQIHQQHNGITIGQKIIICFRFSVLFRLSGSGYWAFSTSVSSRRQHNPYSPLPVAVMAQVEATHQLATQLEGGQL